MKLIVAALLFAGCLYGAYAHLQEQEKRIAEAEVAKTAAETKRVESLRATESLAKRVEALCDRMESDKADWIAKTKAELNDDFLKKKSAIDREIQQYSLETGSALGVESAAIQTDIDRLAKLVAKEEQVNKILLGYVSAEEAKTKTKAAFRTTNPPAMSVNVQ